MSYTPPHGTLDASWVGADPYTPADEILGAKWGGEDKPLTIRRLAPVGWNSAAVPGTKFYREWEYPPPHQIVNGYWTGAPPYTPPVEVLNVVWTRTGGADQYIFTEGADSLAMGAPVASYEQTLAPPGIAAGETGLPEVEQVYRVNASWVGALPYTPPTVMVYGWWSGIPDGSVFPAGWRSSVVGQPSIRNTAEQIRPSGIGSQLAFGVHHIWNWRQYLLPGSWASQAFGSAFVSGGVKHVTLNGIASFASGSHTVINTTADQTIDLSIRGIAPVAVPGPSVSPRFLRPGAIYATGFGFPQVQFPPRPAGWQSSTFGYPVIDFKTKVLAPPSIAAPEPGFPNVRDRAQTILHIASPVTALFGDVQIRLLNQYARPVGVDALEVSTWAEIRSMRRPVYPAGTVQTSFGQTEIANKTPALWPAGFDAQRFGQADVGFYYRSIFPSGVPAPFQPVPSPSLWQTPSLRPAGIAAPAVPPPTVWPAVRAVEPAGADTSLFGGPTVSFSWRSVRLEEHGISAALYGSPKLEHSVRTLIVPGHNRLAFGTAWVSYGLREIQPAGIEYPYMSSHMIGGTRYIGPEGWDSVRWLTRIIPDAQLVEQAGRRSDVFGLPRIENATRRLFLEGITYPEPSMRWGVARVWNLRQIITLYEDLESGLVPPAWPQWTKIENRNKTISAYGFVATRYGYAGLANNARLVHPADIAAPSLPEYQKTGSVTHRIRPLPLEGIEPPYISGWSVVYNKAFPLKPPAINAALFGQAEVVNTRRYRKIESFESMAFGYPFVAYAIRELTFESRYAIQPPVIALPDVFLYTRYIEPAGLESGRVGQQGIVETRFNKVWPKWSHQHDLFGEPVVRNRTPEYAMRGWDTSLWGDTHIRLQWRAVQAEGQSMQLFGKAIIADRRRTLHVGGFNGMTVSDKVRVQRIGEEPVVPQYIDLRRFITNADGDVTELDIGYGIAPPLTQMGTPDLLKGYIFHGVPATTNREMTLWGTPYVTANTIRVEPGYGEYLVGEPEVSLFIRRIEVPTMGQLVQDSVDSSGGRDMGSWGKPRMSPHTIWAVEEAPAQAIRNHGMNQAVLRPVNSGIRLGSPRVSQWLGKIDPTGIPPSAALGSVSWGVGRPSLYNLRQEVRPFGTLMQRFGWPVVPGTQNIVLDDEDALIGPAVFGRPEVSRPPAPPVVRPNGIAAAAFGAAYVDFYHRTLRPTGFFSQAFGYSRDAVNASMPQSLHVGPPHLHPVVGFTASAYGQAWISHRVRELGAEGWDSFLCEYDLERFGQRMRVWRTVEEIPSRRITALGIEPTEYGVPDVKLGARYIRPDGNAEQFRKGAF